MGIMPESGKEMLPGNVELLETIVCFPEKS